MKNLNKIAIAVSIICGSVSAVSHAQSALYNPSWYIAPSVNMMDPDDRFGVDKNGVGGGLRFGKPISNYWDLQMGTSYSRSKTNNARYQQNTLGVDMLYMFSRKSIRPFLLVGAGYERDKTNFPLRETTRSSPYISGGAGLQIVLSDQWSMQADYRRVHGYLRGNDFGFNRSNNDYVTVGLNYAFNKSPAPYVPVARVPEPVQEVVVVAPPVPVAPAPQPVPQPAPRFERYTLSATELFGFDSAELQMPQPKLDEVATALRNNSGINNVVITGYADRLGSNQYNQRLSERRAVSVKNYLTSKGVDSSRLKAEGKGEANPVVVCTNKNRPALIKCLEPNRRVEIEQITVERRVQ